MNTQPVGPVVQADERTLAITYAANTRGLNFLLFALLIDIIFRNVMFDQQCWDLFALIIISGAISRSYMARHQVLTQMFTKKVGVVMAVVAIVAAIVAAIMAMNQGG